MEIRQRPALYQQQATDALMREWPKLADRQLLAPHSQVAQLQEPRENREFGRWPRVTSGHAKLTVKYSCCIAFCLRQRQLLVYVRFEP